MSCEQNGPIAATSCDPCGPAIRNRWFRGKMVTAADYDLEQRYLINRRRMITQAALGSGIVRGYEVEYEDGIIAVSPGTAFDCYGRELLACERTRIGKADDVIWLDRGKCGLHPLKDDPVEGEYVLSAHYAEREVNGVRVGSDCGDDACVPNHLCETVVFSLRPFEKGKGPLRALPCGELDPTPKAEPRPGYYEPQVASGNGYWGPAGLCHCGESLDDACCCDACHAPHLARWNDLRLDFDAGVPLAIVVVRLDDCKHARFAKLVRIINECRLTTIQDVGWRNWHERPDIVIRRSNFAAMFIDPPADTRPRLPSEDDYLDDEEDYGRRPPKERKYPPVATRFWVCFSAPVQIASITRDIVTMTLVQPDPREGVGNVVEVPIAGVWCRKTLDHDPPGTTRGFYFFVHYQFWQGEIQRGARTGFQSETQVAVRIDGNSIIDWQGRAIDADSLGRRLPTGNGTQGGVLLSSWRVKRGESAMPAYGDPTVEVEAKPSPKTTGRKPATRAAS